MAEIIEEINTDNACDAIVKSSTRITPDASDEVRQLVLQIEDPAFRYAAGQSIGVLVPGPHEFGNEFHHRRYSIASPVQAGNSEAAELEILVKRCFYLDEISGERYPGVASNYLCNAKPGDKIRITGPYRSPFKVPSDDQCNLLMIGTGTGVAPFRAFTQQIYDQHDGWKGDVRLFYGDQGGMNLLYLNDKQDDLGHYYDDASFKAFSALIDRPLADATDGLEESLAAHTEECLRLLRDPKTYVFLAGQEKAAAVFAKVMAEAIGSEDEWKAVKKKLISEDRWAELLYH
ncbi:MAG: oxidoreductase [Candidatus Thiodiazotropha sp. (ex Gloverina cf. vestifex)]|nr:oxidoreductase [Candidatus Thiodiazotropha sp. (ex Gloverina cf. vestifex)]